MMKYMRFAIIALAVLLLACKKERPQIPAAAENVAGTYSKMLVIDGTERNYIVYVPETAAGNEKVPVLFMIHGTNQTGKYHHDRGLWNTKAHQEGFIVIYPTALVYCHFDNGNQRTTTKWAAGDLGQTDVGKGALPLCSGEVLADDILFFDELADAVKNEFVVDEKRFYLTGFSNGGQMAARLVAERSETYAAATIHAGNLSEFITPSLVDSPMSLVVTAGANDGLFASAVGMDTPVPLDANLLSDEGVQSLISPFLGLIGLSETYTYSTIQAGGTTTADFFFETSSVGLDNNFRFTLIEGLNHSYTDILIDPYWAFLKEESLQ